MAAAVKLFAVGLLSILMAAGADAAPLLEGAAELLLAQVGECLAFARGEVVGVSTSLLHAGGKPAFSMHQLLSTLGIGALTVVFFVPAALVADWLMRRADQLPRGR